MTLETTGATQADREFHAPVESKSNTLEQWSQTMENLETGVGVVVELRRRLDRLASSDNDSEVESGLDQAWEMVCLTVPAENMSRYDQLQEIEAQLKQLPDLRTKILSGSAVTPQEFQWTKDRQRELRSEAQDLMTDERVVFLMSVRDVLDDLRRKRNLLRRLRQDPEATLNEYNKRLHEGQLHPEDIVQSIETPFETMLVVSDQAFTRVKGKGQLGFHFAHSPFSLVRQHHDLDQTVRHEQTHNYLDAAGSINGYLEKDSFAELEAQIKKMDAVEWENTLEDLLRKNPFTLLDRLHNELLAELENWEQRFALAQPTVGQRIDRALKPFAHYVDQYSTAGSEAMAIKKTYNVAASRTKNAEQSSGLKHIAEVFERVYIETIQNMIEAVQTAQSYGPDASEHVHALMAVLPPSRYRILQRYLKHRYRPPQEVPQQEAA